MPMLAFLPWFKIDEPLAVADFELLPYQRAVKPAGDTPEQAMIASVLKPYYETPDRQVRYASIIRLKGKALTADLDDDERDRVFQFAELVAFVGLSVREYFGLGVTYCNSHNFMPVIQAFRQEASGAVIITRRRDGNSTGYIPASAFKEIKPPHVSEPIGLKLDPVLLNAMIAAAETDTALVEAISSFVRANTDSNHVSPHQEAVSMTGAFERLLGMKKGMEDPLVEAFCLNFKPKSDSPVSTAPRIPAHVFGQCGSIREAWMRDFFRVRGNLAHGKTALAYKSAWPLKEHLLLSAYAFPLLVKCHLAKANLYQLTDTDRFDIDIFERLAAVDLFETPQDQKGSTDSHWGRIHESFRIATILERFWS